MIKTKLRGPSTLLHGLNHDSALRAFLRLATRQRFHAIYPHLLCLATHLSTEDDYTLLMQAINLLGNDAGNLEDIKQILAQVRDRLEALLHHGN